MLKAAARKIWLTRWPPRTECLKNAERKVVIGEYKNGNPKYGKEHQCAKCENWFPQVRGNRNQLKPYVEVNHKNTVGGFGKDITNWADDLAEIYRNLLVPVEELECLCPDCHQIITNKERKEKKK